MDPSRIDQIIETGPSLHTAGTFSPKVLKALVRHASKRQILFSAETGSGSSTLLFSHLSANHTVFAMDAGSGSITNVRRSPLFHSERVTFVEGPTQKTLPHHVFTNKLQAVLLDGPHAFPFPELEYYFLYPQLATGALLVLDDIQIPSVHNLFRFVRADKMFSLDEVVDATAFFTRTSAPTFDPYSDGWSLQNYNAKPLRRYGIYGQIRDQIPERLRRKIQSWMKLARPGPRPSVTIEHPAANAPVKSGDLASGRARVPVDGHLWLLARRSDSEGWWPLTGGPMKVIDGRWSAAVKYGDDGDNGYAFELAAVIVGPATHDSWLQWVLRVEQEGAGNSVTLPRSAHIMDEAFRTVRKAER